MTSLEERLKQAEDRIFDVLLADDGQAYKEARKYLEQYRPDLIERIDNANDQSSLISNRRDGF